MTPPMTVLLVLLAGFALSPAAHAGRYVDIDHGHGLSTYRPPYLDNNHGRLAPYGMGELRSDKHFKKRSFDPEQRRHQSLKHGSQHRRYPHREPTFGREFGYRERHHGYGRHYKERGPDVRYSLRPFDDRHRGGHRDDFGRFSIRIGGDHDRGEVIFFNFPVSPRHRD